MQFSRTLKDTLLKVLPAIDAEAHCDIPCGIYDPTPAKIAAKTVQRMVMQIQELKPPSFPPDPTAMKAMANMMVRRIKVKEDHAEQCKHEILILWTDFFKPEHLEKFPELHNTVWKAAKLCSKNKQEVSVDAANDLVVAVDSIAEIFYEAKNVPNRFEAYKEITDKLF